MHILHSESGFSTQGSLPSPLSLQRAQTRWLSKLAITWPQVLLLWPGEDIYNSYIYRRNNKSSLKKETLNINHNFQYQNKICVH